MFHVPRHNPRLIDDQFAARFPALGLRTTSNSGAYWGDGDMCSIFTDYDQIQFALESKVRYNNRKTLLPSPSEYLKALKQLHVRNSHAIRLFLVYSHPQRKFGMSLPEKDAKMVEAYGINLGGEKTQILPKRGDAISIRYLDEEAWDVFYRHMKELTMDSNK